MPLTLHLNLVSRKALAAGFGARKRGQSSLAASAVPLTVSGIERQPHCCESRWFRIVTVSNSTVLVSKTTPSNAWTVREVL